MGDRIAFPPRARDCASKDGIGASWLEPRVKFVEGSTTPTGDQVKVGSGSLYPLQVSIDQMFEIFYRSRDAQFDDSSALLTTEEYGSGFGGVETNVFLSAQSPPANHEVLGGDHEVVRAYWLNSANPTNEAEMWEDLLTTAPSFVAFDGSDFPAEHQCGLRHYINSQGETSDNGTDYHLYVGPGGDVGFMLNNYLKLQFSGRVAFVDNEGNGNPLDPANTLYVGMYFEAFYNDGIAIDYTASSYDGLTGFSGSKTGWQLDIVLSSGTLTVDLLCYYGIGLNPTPTGSNLVITVNDWWPYAKIDGTDYWDTTTGLFKP